MGDLQPDGSLVQCSRAAIWIVMPTEPGMEMHAVCDYHRTPELGKRMWEKLLRDRTWPGDDSVMCFATPYGVRWVARHWGVRYVD